MSILILGARLINPATGMDKVTDILIEKDRIAKIGDSIITDAETIVNGLGMWVVPGFIDVHCHLRDPGFEHKETIETGAKSAAKGGFTTICPMPNTDPPVDSASIVYYIKDQSKKVAPVNVLPIGAITKGMAGEELSDIDEMAAEGICAISEDGKTVEDPWLMIRGMLKAMEHNLPVLCHCEDKKLVAGGVMNEGAIAEELGLPPISDASEDTIIQRDVDLAKESGARVHICHITTKGGVEIIRRAKKEGANVTAEVCPHHFTLTDMDVARYGTNAKMAPPLRDADDVGALIHGLHDGTIDIIATDHAPHTNQEKDVGMSRAPFGIVGFETAFSLGNTVLVEEGFLTAAQLIEKMTVNPAKLLGIDKGSLEEGKIADVVLIDPEEEYLVDANKFSSKSKNCPYNGRKLKGKVKMTIVSGKIVAEDN